ncbi:MAG: CrcB family protein, partial [bacterium]|nr:CrcB family protein [Candidatus Minthenecus merdequi]
HTSLYMFLTVGLCGSFTTFSTMIKDTSIVGSSENWLMSALYVELSVANGLVLYRIGDKIVGLYID